MLFPSPRAFAERCFRLKTGIKTQLSQWPLCRTFLKGDICLLTKMTAPRLFFSPPSRLTLSHLSFGLHLLTDLHLHIEEF